MVVIVKIVLPDKINISDEHKAKLRELGAEMFEDLPSEDELKARIKDVEVIIVSYVDITSELIDAAPSESIVELARLPNVIATPHIAYNTEEINDKQGIEILMAVQSCMVDKPINVVKWAAS